MHILWLRLVKLVHFQKLAACGKSLFLFCIVSMLLGLNFSVSAAAKYKTDIPKGLITPDKVKMKLLGDLNFKNGMPSAQTVQKIVNPRY